MIDKYGIAPIALWVIAIAFYVSAWFNLDNKVDATYYVANACWALLLAISLRIER